MQRYVLALHLFMDKSRLMHMGRKFGKSHEPKDKRKPILIQGKHALTKWMGSSEHLELLQTGPTLVMTSLARLYAIVGAHRVIRDTTRSCTSVIT